MIGLICIGLMGLGGILFITLSSQGQESVAIPPTPTPFPPTFTPTSTPSATPTETPLPTPTGTLVVGSNGEGQEAAVVLETPTTDPQATPTNTLVLQQTPTGTTTPVITATATAPPAEGMPAGGGVLPAGKNSFLIWAGVIMLLALAFSAVHYFQPSSGDS